ncbi:MAG: carbonic anhydrase [Clostridium sp.]
MKKNKVLMAIITGVTTATLLVGCGSKETKTEEIFKRPEVKNSQEALTLLKDGNIRFKDEKSLKNDLSKERKDELKGGQKPFALVVSCSDSRVSSPLIFNQGLGDLFEVKLAGNVINDEALGTIEYGVEHLNIPLIVVMGHEKCGAVGATVEALGGGDSHAPEKESKILSLVNRIKPAYDIAKKNNKDAKNLQEEVCDENINLISKEISSNPIVKEKLEKGTIKIVEAKYFFDGQVKWE